MDKKIIINFPTNIGDTIISLPVVDKIRANYPDSVITAIASARTIDFLKRNSFINEVIRFDKAWKVTEKIKFSFSLRNKFDIFIDLKHSFLPIIAASPKHTPFKRKQISGILAKDAYIKTIEHLAPKPAGEKSFFRLLNDEEMRWQQMKLQDSIFIACASRSSLKQYPGDYLRSVIETLSKRARVVILGEDSDKAYYKEIAKQKGIIDLVGKTRLYDIAYLLTRYAKLLLCVDSSILQLASYYDIPTVAIFGPTDQKRYGPWAKKSIVLRQESLSCAPCQTANCYRDNECMEISPTQVLDAVEEILSIEKNEQ